MTYCLLKGAPVGQRSLLMAAGAAWRFKPPNLLKALDASVCTDLVILDSVLRDEPETPGWKRLLAPFLALAFLLLLVGGVLVLRKRKSQGGP